jgi:DUF971 family protein
LKPETDALDIGPTPDGSRLRIVWADGHVSLYSPLYLRLNCRCAGCVDEFTGDPLLEPSHVPGDVYARAIHHVGGYALQFDWSDEHKTGIYPFDLLRAICPCDDCGDDVA